MRFHAAVVAAAAAAAMIASVGGGGFPPGPGATGPTPTLIAASYPGSATWPPSGTDEEAGVGARSEQRTTERAHPSRNLADPARSATVDTSTESADQDRDGGHSCPTTAPARTSGRSTDDDSAGSRVTATAILAGLITELAGTTGGNTGNTGNRIVQTLLGTADSDTEPARDTAAARVPGDLIDLADWYLTLPTGKQGDPDTVENPELAKFTNEFFTLDDTGEAVVFSARGDGVTTKNSHYPRSELREMNGSEKASWTNTSGTHTLDVCEAITKVPAAQARGGGGADPRRQRRRAADPARGPEVDGAVRRRQVRADHRPRLQARHPIPRADRRRRQQGRRPLQRREEGRTAAHGLGLVLQGRGLRPGQR